MEAGRQQVSRAERNAIRCAIGDTKIRFQRGITSKSNASQA
jgi:hypothetical protein